MHRKRQCLVQQPQIQSGALPDVVWCIVQSFGDLSEKRAWNLVSHHMRNLCLFQAMSWNFRGKTMVLHNTKSLACSNPRLVPHFPHLYLSTAQDIATVFWVPPSQRTRCQHRSLDVQLDTIDFHLLMQQIVAEPRTSQLTPCPTVHTLTLRSTAKRATNSIMVSAGTVCKLCPEVTSFALISTASVLHTLSKSCLRLKNNLTSLDLSQCGIDDTSNTTLGTSWLEALPHLRTLKLGPGVSYTTDDFEPIDLAKTFKQLTELELHAVPGKPCMLRDICDIQTLTTLRLFLHGQMFPSIELLLFGRPATSNVRNLDLRYGRFKATRGGGSTFLDVFPAVTHLHLENCSLRGSHCLHARAIEHLALIQCTFTRDKRTPQHNWLNEMLLLQSVATTSGFSLKSVRLVNNRPVPTVESLKILLPHCPKLTHVDLSHYRPFSDSMLDVLLHLPQLTSLSVSHCPVTETHALTLVRGMPHLLHLDLTGTALCYKPHVLAALRTANKRLTIQLE